MSTGHANLATSLVVTAPSPSTSGTSLVVTTGEGSRFPTVPFWATIWPPAEFPTTANSEVVRVTARSSDTLTIARAQGGTTAKGITAGYRVANTVVAADMSPALDVRRFGAVGDGSSDDTNYIQDAIDSLDPAGGTLIFPEGRYAISDTLVFRDGQRWIIAFDPGVEIITRSGSDWSQSPVNKPMVDFGGTKISSLVNPCIRSTMAVGDATRPSCALLMTRSVLKDGAYNTIHNPFMYGAFTAGTFINIGSEVVHCYDGNIYSSVSTVPAYLDVDSDINYELGTGGNFSNTDKHFTGTTLGNQATGAVSSVVIVQRGWAQEIGFHSCYFFTLTTATAHMIDLIDDTSPDPNGSMGRLTIEGGRYEYQGGGSATAGTRLIYSTKTAGIASLVLRPDFNWSPTTNDFLIECAGGLGLSQSDIDHRATTPKLYKGTGTAQCRLNTIRLVEPDGMIALDGTGAYFVENVVASQLGMGTGLVTLSGGALALQSGDALGRQDNIHINSAASAAFVGIPVMRRQQYVFGNGDTTPAVTGLSIWETANTGATSISAFDGTIQPGQDITVFVKDVNTTFVHSVANTVNTLKLAGSVNWAAPNGSCITFTRDDRSSGVWRETGRVLP